MALSRALLPCPRKQPPTNGGKVWIFNFGSEAQLVGGPPQSSNDQWILETEATSSGSPACEGKQTPRTAHQTMLPLISLVNPLHSTRARHSPRSSPNVPRDHQDQYTSSHAEHALKSPNPLSVRRLARQSNASIMSTTTSYKNIYRNKDYSDITIKFSGREIPCHKVIICTQSEYFKKLCGKGSQFAESDQKIVELKEDDPDAVVGIIRQLYFGSYLFNNHTDKNWKFHAEVVKAANKVCCA